MYGKMRYGISKYSQEAASEQYQDEYFHDVSKYVPDYLIAKRELRASCHAEGYEIGLAYHNIRDSFDQMFLTTATWGLNRWEDMYGIETNLSLSYEQRREITVAKIRGQGTTTRQMIEDTAAAFSGGEVQVIEDNPRYHFVVRFVGVKGIPRNMQAFIDMLEEIKPAHLSYSFEYTYTVWDNLRTMTWTEMKWKSWKDVKIMEGV